jgi:hypothetical protein
MQGGRKNGNGKVPSVLKKIESLWNEVYPDYVYEPILLDAKIESFYSQENRLSHLYKIFAALAIFLSCLGLYGLASFHGCAKNKRSGHQKSAGSIDKEYHRAVLKRVFNTYCHCIRDCSTFCVVLYA